MLILPMHIYITHLIELIMVNHYVMAGHAFVVAKKDFIMETVVF